MTDRKLDEFYPMRTGVQEQGLKELISYINSFSPTWDMKMIEIGSYIGESTIMFAKRFRYVYSIDPFVEEYPGAVNVFQYAKFSKVYEKFLENISNFANINSIRLTSDEAINIFNNIKLDFVYIDGAHTYEQVHKDITNYMPIIKEGGFIGGHDYVPGWNDVMQAVNELLGIPDQTFVDGSWVKRMLI